jgi:hypothetical protein
MIGRTSRALFVALLSAGLALTAATGAASAAPSGAASAAPSLSITATDMTYGQPDITGGRFANTTITITNNGASTVQFPTLTFPVNGRDTAVHGEWSGCPSGRSRPDSVSCVAEPLAAGEQRHMVFPFGARGSGPAGPATVRFEAAADAVGTPIPGGTVVNAMWQASFAPLTGTFDITATDLTYGPQDRYGIQHGSTKVTLTNLTKNAVPYPLVTFPTSSGDAAWTVWRGCQAIVRHANDIVCVAKPLAAGQRRVLTFPFFLVGPTMEFEASVLVDAGADVDGSVIGGTAAGTVYDVKTVGDAN